MKRHSSGRRGGFGRFAGVWAVCRGQGAGGSLQRFGQFAGGRRQRFGQFAGGSLQGAGGSGLGSFREKAPLAVLGGAMAAGGRSSSLRGRGQWLRRRRATAAALGAGGSGYGGGGLRQLLAKLLTETGDAEAAPPAPKAADGDRRCRSRAPCPQSS